MNLFRLKANNTFLLRSINSNWIWLQIEFLLHQIESWVTQVSTRERKRHIKNQQQHTEQIIIIVIIMKIRRITQNVEVINLTLWCHSLFPIDIFLPNMSLNKNKKQKSAKWRKRICNRPLIRFYLSDIFIKNGS